MEKDNHLDSIWAVTVNWNQADFTIKCISSIKSNGFKDQNIIVVDNGSLDDSAEKLSTKFPNINVILLEKNLGFAGGFNAGIRYALSNGAQYILMINNDAEIENGALEFWLNATREYNADITAPAIYYANPPNKIWSAGGYFHPLLSAPLNAHRRNKPLPESPVDRDFLTGCALLLKKSVFEKIGYFDEHFFLYYEDLDFFMRAKKSGLKIMLIPGARVYHNVSASSQTSNSGKVYYWMGRSTWIYFKKHAKWWQWFFIVPWQIGHMIKTIAALIIKKDFPKIRSFLLGFFGIKKMKYGNLYKS